MVQQDRIKAHSEVADILSKVSLEEMRQAHGEDIKISKAMCYAKSGKKPTLAQIHKIKSRPVHRYLCQFDWLIPEQALQHRI